MPVADEGGHRAWVFSIARNLALNHVRDDRRRAGSRDLTETSAPATQELTAALEEALARLAPLDRDVFLLREAGGLSYEEISHACEIRSEEHTSELQSQR